MTIVYSDPVFQRHQTGRHPENPHRLAAIDAHLQRIGLAAALPHGRIADVDGALLAAVHDSDQIATAKALSKAGGGDLDPDTVLSDESFAVALKAAGTAVAAVDEVMAGRHENAFCLLRPPGHHATQDRSMGFCIFNNVAVAARHAQRAHGAGRVLIVDWDVHHGNGTQDIFYDDEGVVFFSIHRHPFYPGTGRADETGTGRGLGATVNVPVAYGTSREQYLALFGAGLDRAVAKARPDLIVVSAGFDAHADDPIGSLGLQAEDFAAMARMVRDAAHAHCAGRVVACLEGGYDPGALAASVEATLRALSVPMNTVT